MTSNGERSGAKKRPAISAFLALVVLISAWKLQSCTSSPPLPLDVTPTGGLDENGFDLNPTWASQNAQGVGPFLLAAPLACAPSGSDQDTSQNWYSGPHPCTHFHVTTNRGFWCGPHVNWFPVAYQADSIAFESHSSFSYDGAQADDDYNVDLLRKDYALYTAGKPTYAQLYSEFDSDETIDHFKTAWWQSFRSAVDDESNDFASAKSVLVNSKGAIAIGLLGLDCAYNHGCDVELHPVYILAIHISDAPNDDHWAFFARNKADEGYCSAPKESLYPLTRSGNPTYTYKLLLPRADVSSFAVIKKDVRIYGKGTSTDAGSAFSADIVNSKGALLSFTLPNPDQQLDSDGWVIEGEIELAWTFNRPQLTVVVSTTPALDPGQFNVLVDGIVVAAGVPAAFSTGPQPFSVGGHKVSEQGSPGINLSSYSVVIGRDCKPDGSITLAAGDNKTCTIMNTNKAWLSCTKTCQQAYQDCLSSGLTPKECSVGRKNCLEGGCKQH